MQTTEIVVVESAVTSNVFVSYLIVKKMNVVKASVLGKLVNVYLLAKPMNVVLKT